MYSVHSILRINLVNKEILYSMYFYILAIVLIVLGFISHGSQKYMRDAISNIPGPFCVPLLGAVHLIFKVDPKNIFKTATEFGLQYGPVLKTWGLNRLFVMSADAELNEQLLASNTHITKQRNYGILHQWLGVGLLMSDGKKWHSRRKIITPTFHFKILEQFVEVFDQQASVLIDCLAEKADGEQTFDVYPYICNAALDIIAETSMGTKVNAQTDTTMQYTKAVNEMTKMMAWRFMKLHLNNEIVFSICYPFKKLRQMKLISSMHDFTRKVIEERRQALEESLKNTTDNDHDEHDIGTKKRMALLDVLLQSTIDGKPLSDEDIREEVDTFMFEGHDTTTSAISFGLYLLARHPQVQNKLLAEIKKILGEDKTKPLTLRDLNEMKYLENVIKEILRLYPSVPIVGRQITQDFKYKHSRLGDGIIPAGTEFFIMIFGMTMDPTRYENNHDFIPERHENSDSSASGAFSLIPFSAGPRNCIGQKFAMNEMKVILTKVVHEYELLPLGEDVVPELNIVMRSSTGMQLGIKKRITHIQRNCWNYHSNRQI